MAVGWTGTFYLNSPGEYFYNFNWTGFEGNEDRPFTFGLSNPALGTQFQILSTTWWIGPNNILQAQMSFQCLGNGETSFQAWACALS